MRLVIVVTLGLILMTWSASAQVPPCKDDMNNKKCLNPINNVSDNCKQLTVDYEECKCLDTEECDNTETSECKFQCKAINTAGNGGDMGLMAGDDDK